MSFFGLARHAVREFRDNFSSSTWWKRRVISPYLLGTATRLHPRYPGYDEAVRVMDEDWDNLVVLDACRADAFESVLDLDNFDDYERQISLGSHSSEWTRRNFAGREFGDTVYVTANPHTGMIAPDSFHKLVELQESEFDEEMETVLPERMVEVALEVHEEHPDKRLIVHFMQPHGPFVHEEATPPPFEGTVEDFWDEYRKSLEYVLPYVRDLADQVGGKTVITADHGQTYKRKLWGGIPIHTHPPRLRVPELVTVPWATIEGERREIQAGDVHRVAESDDLEQRLEHLGYR